MVRFYCTVCKRVKRVRQYPTRILNEYATTPADRVGVCNRHNQPARKSTPVVNSIGQIRFKKVG